MNYRCSECHNENIFISFSADYLGTVKIGGINNMICSNCGAVIRIDEQAENKGGKND